MSATLPIAHSLTAYASLPNIENAGHELNRAIERDDTDRLAAWARTYGAMVVAAAKDSINGDPLDLLAMEHAFERIEEGNAAISIALQERARGGSEDQLKEELIKASRLIRSGWSKASNLLEEML